MPIHVSGLLLNHVLDHHTQTRSADSVVDLLLTSSQSSTFEEAPSGHATLYITAATGALLHHTFLDKFSKVLQGFTTPGQINKIVQNTLEHLRTASLAFENRKDENDSTPRKRRKTTTGPQPGSIGAEPSAIAFAMISGIASVVLTSLPLHLLQTDDRQAVVNTLQDYYRASQGTMKSVSKRIRSGDDTSTWSSQIVASALLRLRYTLSSDRRLQLDTEGDAKLMIKLVSLLETEALLPELRVEIVSLSDLQSFTC